jgi:hypothetical protein
MKLIEERIVKAKAAVATTPGDADMGVTQAATQPVIPLVTTAASPTDAANLQSLMTEMKALKTKQADLEKAAELREAAAVTAAAAATAAAVAAAQAAALELEQLNAKSIADSQAAAEEARRRGLELAYLASLHRVKAELFATKLEFKEASDKDAITKLHSLLQAWEAAACTTFFTFDELENASGLRGG